ncbi:nicotinamide-nucleotide adenylyltransferase 2 [Cordyceps fumosorosea ARSEF 2679]|uniref:Nicotinamide-nucleotide adenylyltransferase n=1 Tax=Cordyceps fumosorosea (strain ARSEF 2679) TaxID=1081104 RepID=A0A167STV2_CORFA|nr:nicotinamide-nucleotide adenylyltransferase 2 [Cordyceps fumosorosea ARSEF 2679]OAA59921.1 nicotinamide-nucleotide adenylyltransferase 2 [Cordyceps fumosorosea ARSEF 2679]
MGSTLSLPPAADNAVNAERRRVTPASAPAVKTPPSSSPPSDGDSDSDNGATQTASAAAIQAQQLTPPPSPPSPSAYTFPAAKLKRRLTQPGKTPLVLVACGSFSPITKLHVQMFELAARHVPRTEFEIVGNYLSPCSDAYNKASLVPAHHRLQMCSLAVDGLPIHVDDWEATRVDAAGRPLYSRTADVLRHFDSAINDDLGGIQAATDGTASPLRARIVLLIGADLALTMSNPRVWAPADIDVLLGYYGAFVVERPHQCDVRDAIAPLRRYRHNIWVVDAFENDVSSTKVRAQIQNREQSMDIPGAVFKYIKLHRLYLE